MGKVATVAMLKDILCFLTLGVKRGGEALA